MGLLSSAVSAVLGLGSSGGKDQKACLIIEKEGGGDVTFNCQFNPEEFHINSRGKFTKETRQGEDSPLVQFMGGSVSTLDLKLYFDTSTSYELGGNIPIPTKKKPEDVNSYVSVLMDLVKIRGKLHRPPLVTFCWGSVEVSGVVINIDAQYVAFEADGMPVRAEVTMQLMTMALEPMDEMKLSPKESPDRSKSILLTEDSSLWDIAEREYGDAGKWREIADANDIMDPLCVPSGIRLRVPALK